MELQDRQNHVAEGMKPLLWLIGKSKPVCRDRMFWSFGQRHVFPETPETNTPGASLFDLSSPKDGEIAETGMFKRIRGMKVVTLRSTIRSRPASAVLATSIGSRIFCSSLAQNHIRDRHKKISTRGA